MSTALVVERPAPAHPAAIGAARDLTWPLRYIAACVLLAAFCFNTAPGRIVADTKLDLAVDPARFLGRALHMWDSQGFAGQVQNQAYGYFFPMGPFFALGHLAQLQPWAVQRLWWTALLCMAFLGVARLAAALDIGSPGSRFLAGLAYALSPHILSVLGPVSAEALPMCLTPWVLIPLVRAAQSGSVRRGALLSGLAVLGMGGINATLDLAALVPVVLWFLTRRPSRRLFALAGWWVAAVAAATFWWVAPLLLLGRYSPPFLDYIESAATTTSTTSPVESLRGTADWVPYIPGSGWHAGEILLSTPAVILNSVVVVALGLAGLTLSSLRERRWLALCLLAGVVLVGLGHVGSVDGWWAGDLRTLLDGPLAPLRNVHKFDVAIRLPLVLGLAQLVGRVRWGISPFETQASRIVVAAVAAVAVGGTAAPLLSLQAAPAGSFEALPGYWADAALWLAGHHSGRALVVPGSHTGLYLWGRTSDEPMQPLAHSAWEVRDGVPLVSTGGIRSLDAVEQLLDAGTGSPRLASYLAQAGITTLVVRNDLDYTTVGAPRPLLVHRTLAHSPGFTRRAAYGGTLGVNNPGQDSDLQQPYPALEIFSVDGAPADPVDAQLATSVSLVSGGPESLLTAPSAAAGATVLAGDADPSTGDRAAARAAAGPVVLTDGLRRREANFGENVPDTSATMTAEDPTTLPAAARDYLPYPGDEHQSVAVLLGAKAVTASSSASSASASGRPVPGYQPFAAVDADPQTQWRSDPAASPVGQWLQLILNRSVSARYVDLDVAPTGAGVTDVRIDAGPQSVTQEVVEGTPVRIPLSGAAIGSVRVTVTAAAGRFVKQVGISTVRLPGVAVARTIRVADDLPADRAVDTISFAAAAGRRTGCFPGTAATACAAYLERPGEDDAGLDRSFTLPVPASYRWSATAQPRPGQALNALVNRAVRPAILASASSSAVADPAGSAQAAADGDLGTGWVASPQDPNPTLSLRWSGQRRVSSLRLRRGAHLAATAPTSATVVVGGRVRPARIGADGTVRFAAVTTDRLTLRLGSGGQLSQTYDPDLGYYVSLGVGVSEVSVPGLATTVVADVASRRVELPCGTTPTVTIDDQPVQTAATATVGDLLALTPITLRLCAPLTAAAVLGAGAHRVLAPSTSAWLATALAGERIGASASTDGRVGVSVTSWSSTDRRVRVDARAGPAVLRVTENANAGWTAVLDGHRLPTIVLNGWQQGFLLPAGAAASVHLRYAPDRSYRIGLLIGAVAAAVLVACVLVPGRRRSQDRRQRRDHGQTIEPAASGWLVPVAGVVACVLVAGWWGLIVSVVVGVGVRAVRRWSRGPAPGGGVGPAVVAIPYLIGGLVLAVRHLGTASYAGTSVPVQLAVVASLAVVAWWTGAPGPATATPVPPRTDS